jgi:hypothetical protein
MTLELRASLFVIALEDKDRSSLFVLALEDFLYDEDIFRYSFL